MDDFERFVASAEPRLRRALVAAYGSGRGREATAEALAWAWEHWDRLQLMANPVGYLFRVGQSRSRTRRRRVLWAVEPAAEPWFEPALPGALAGLSVRQRTAVVLVHGYGMTYQETADLLGLQRATVQRHVERALKRLRVELGVSDERPTC